MTGYYDIILGLIPLTLVGVTGTLSLAGFAMNAAVPIAALIAVALVGHALFVRSPVHTNNDTQSTTTSSTSSPFNSAD